MNGKELILKLWKKPSARDLQKTIGASSFGSPCTYCVASELARTAPQERSKFWLPSRIGTAIHLDFEHTVKRDLPNAMPEQRVYLGELEDYGEIWSTCDFYDPDLAWLADFKTTTRTKLSMYRLAVATEPDPLDLSAVTEARFTLDKYKGQILSYGRGIELMGYPVRTVSLAFVCRDGLTDEDVWSLDLEYSREQADRVWDRLVSLWDYVRGGGDVEKLNSKPGCYTCGQAGRV